MAVLIFLPTFLMFAVLPALRIPICLLAGTAFCTLGVLRWNLAIAHSPSHSASDLLSEIELWADRYNANVRNSWHCRKSESLRTNFMALLPHPVRASVRRI
jgi:hypothetical protein